MQRMWSLQDAQAALGASVAAAQAQHDDLFFPLVPDEVVDECGGRWLNVRAYCVKTWGRLHNARQALAWASFLTISTESWIVCGDPTQSKMTSGPPLVNDSMGSRTSISDGSKTLAAPSVLAVVFLGSLISVT